MKFLPESKPKKILLFAIIGALVFGIVYVNFFAFSGPGDDLLTIEPVPGGIPVTGESGLAGGDLLMSKSVLPFGKTINTNILRDNRFTRLQISPEFSVTVQELGNPNPFILP